MQSFSYSRNVYLFISRSKECEVTRSKLQRLKPQFIKGCLKVKNYYLYATDTLLLSFSFLIVHHNESNI